MEKALHQQSPIFTKTTDFILWLLQHTEKFPKIERFRLARRLEDCTFAFYELLMKTVRSSQKRRLLMQADIELEKMRFYTRVSFERKLTNLKQYRYAAGQLVEIGKLLGGWLNILSEK